MEVNVLLEGYLEKCSTAEDHGKRDWKKRYFVYKHFLASSIKCLEYYKDRNWRRQEPKGVLTLYPGYEVMKIHDPKRKFAFDIKTVEHTFRLSAHSEEEENNWILLLEKENIVKSFMVDPVQDELMQRIGACEMCHLHIADNELRLITANDGLQLVAWPFTCLRRYMSNKGKFTIEAGRRAPTGEGKFSFLTSQHDEIYKVLDTVIKSRASRGGSSTPEKPHPRLQHSQPIDSLPQTLKLQNKSYDHLHASPSPNPPHPTHPNYDQNVLPPRKLTGGGSMDRVDGYASPYGHVKPRESITSFSSARDSLASMDSDTLSMGAAHEFLENNQNMEGYDTLTPSIPKRKPQSIHSDGKFDSEDFYNTISDVQGASMSEGFTGGKVEGDMYNTLLHVPVSPTKTSSPGLYDNKSSPQDLGSSYDSLDHTTPKKGPARALDFGSYQQGSIEEDGDNYNVLLHNTSTLGPKTKSELEDYSTLDRSDFRPSHLPLRKTQSSPVVPPRKCPLSSPQQPIPPPRISHAPDLNLTSGKDRSSVSSISSIVSGLCPLDASGSFTDSQYSMSPDQDFYSSVDYATITPSGKPEETSTRESNNPPLPYKPRKASAPDVLSRVPGMSSLVSNLRATLVADGLDLKKPQPARRKHKKVPEDIIPETEDYAEIGEGNRHTSGSVDGLPRNREVRSPSAPAELTEDIYDEPEMPSQQRPKSLNMARGLLKKN
ncbi:uncharacterized protein LOC116617174 [Nematostella vectensis]|nr:uncharacterized protein LOC116617174 [Nematostella vectensis]